MEYKLLEVNPKQFDQKVNELIGIGWKMVGAPFGLNAYPYIYVVFSKGVAGGKAKAK